MILLVWFSVYSGWFGSETWVFEGKRLCIEQTLKMTESLHQQNFVLSNSQPIPIHITWKPPPTSWIKGNFDACLKDRNKTGFGVVFRDAEGRVLGGATDLRQVGYQPHIAKVLWFKWALKVASQMCFDMIILKLIMFKFIMLGIARMA